MKPKSFVGTLVNDKVNSMFSNLLILSQGLVVLCLKRNYILNYSQERSIKFCCGGEILLRRGILWRQVSDNDFPENYDVYINKRYHFSLICSAPRLCFRQSTG